MSQGVEMKILRQKRHLKSVAALGLKKLRKFSTSKKLKGECLPIPLPPMKQTCIIPPPPPPPPCELVKFEKWKPVEKICMPCCCPTSEPVCIDVGHKLNTCKKREYRLPAFSECTRVFDLKQPCLKECCYTVQNCPWNKTQYPGALIPTRITQHWVIGRRTNMDYLKKF